MATFSDARVVYGLSATGTPESTNVSGSVQVGVNQTQIRLADSDIAYSVRAVMATTGDILEIDLTDGTTTGSTSFVAGTAQVETATVVAASGITLSGNATVTVTAAGMTGSPKAVSVALTSTEHTTATLIATAIAAALNADTAYSALFTATSSGADVITTRKSLWSGTPNIYPANDTTLNVAIANGTCTGITTAGTSANTTAGAATTGTKVYDGDGKDFEGVAIPTITVKSILFEGETSDGISFENASTTFNGIIDEEGVYLFKNPTGFLDEVVTFESSAPYSSLLVTVIGKTV